MLTPARSISVKHTAKRILPAIVVDAYMWLMNKPRGQQSNLPEVSSDYMLIDPSTAQSGEFRGWCDPGVATRQDAGYRALVQQMYAGQPRQDLLAAAEAISCTGLKNGVILEVGCGSGYYSEILSYLLQQKVRYVGMDYSQAMIRLAKGHYPDRHFVTGDGTSLPFADRMFDIVLNGVSLMHILNYENAIAETRRVTRQWCIFHTVPVLQQRSTTLLCKKAYGEAIVEVIFNEGEFRGLLEQNGLAVRRVLDSIPYDLSVVLHELTKTKTYVCEVLAHCSIST
jgi:SAM-dependent methyltransferase